MMKFDRLQIRLIVGFIFIAIMWILILIFESKMKTTENQNVNIESSRQVESYNLKKEENNSFYDSTYIMDQNLSMEDLNNNEDNSADKEEVFSLIDKAARSPVPVEAFIYSKQISDEDKFSGSIYYDLDYKGLIDYIHLFNYKAEDYRFNKLRNTDKYIWGSFYKKNSNEGHTYVIVNKADGKIKALNNDLIQVIVY